MFYILLCCVFLKKNKVTTTTHVTKIKTWIYIDTYDTQYISTDNLHMFYNAIMIICDILNIL